MFHQLIALVGLCALALCAPAAARTSQARAQQAHEAGRFDYYVLSLSWSPSYCASHPDDQAQCGVQRHGFVLHGLWPQYDAGGYPQTCRTDARLDEQARAYGQTIFPSEKLVAHEWDKHGTCSGLDALAYFELSGRARDGVAVPARLQPGTRVAQLFARDISRLIRDANPGLRSNMLTVHCAGPQLSEVRVCLSKDLEPRPCGRGSRSSCRPGPIRVPGVR